MKKTESHWTGLLRFTKSLPESTSKGSGQILNKHTHTKNIKVNIFKTLTEHLTILNHQTVPISSS